MYFNKHDRYTEYQRGCYGQLLIIMYFKCLKQKGIKTTGHKLFKTFTTFINNYFTY